MTHTGTTEFLLGVKNSIMGRAWRLRPFDVLEAQAISQGLNVPDIVGRMLTARGQTFESADSFLNPTLKEMMPDPSIMKDMDKAAHLIVDHIITGKTIAIFGDYDVDGATSTSILFDYIQQLGGKCLYYIPDRQKEGYGPNSHAMQKLKEQGADMVVTVDCGITAYQPIADAKSLGLSVVIIDHHKADTDLPEADAVVNPNRLDDESDLGHLAAVGVTFMLIVAINRFARTYPNIKNIAQGIDILGYLSTVSLGTVCDVVPLTGLNRAFVSQGLKVMASRRHLGLTVLSDIAGMDSKPSTYHLGFLLGPRINAGGRVGSAELGTELLLSRDSVKAQQVARLLDGYNQERKDIEAAVEAEAVAAIAQEVGIGGAPWPIALAVGEGWHPGVIGIVASRLKERYNRPAMVISIDEKGEAKGSARSISGVDIGNAVLEAKYKGLITAGGGHSMAAGLSIAVDKLEAFKRFLSDHIEKEVANAIREQTTDVDAVLSISGITPELIDQIDQLAPFGVGNPGAKVVVENVKISKVDIVGGNHIRAFLEGPEGGRIKAMAFRALDSDLGGTLLASQGKKFHVLGKIKKDDWMGRNAVEMTIEDIATAGF